MAAFGIETYCKIVVVIDENVDIFDLADVMLATSTRADRHLVFVHRAMGAIFDPTSDPVDNTLTKSASTDQARRRRLRRASDDRRRAARLGPPHPYPPPNRR
jgi:3-polyprenyl-4-hydroxybenzoate decarboxylase